MRDRYYCSRSCANKHEMTEELRKKISTGVKSVMGPVKTYKYVCKNCGCEFESVKKHRKFCSNKCFGIWKTKHSNRPMKEIYRKLCDFKFSINSYCDEFFTDLIKEHGWYSAKNHGNNLTGISRDHMMSVNYGYLNKIDPYIISHPANCKLMIQSENSKKKDKISISLDELVDKIKVWNSKYGVYPNKIEYSIILNNGYCIEKYFYDL